MAQLADAIRQINERELDANEAAIASCFPAPPEMSPEQHQRVIPFLSWCDAQRVRPLPARPTSVAAYVRFQQDRGVPRQMIAEDVAAIEAMHFAAASGNPVATPIVRTTTAASTIEAPRSWRKDEQLLFSGLPPEIQRVIVRRENDRERTVRRAQNEIAELRKTQTRKDDSNADQGRPLQQERQSGIHDVQAPSQIG